MLGATVPRLAWFGARVVRQQAAARLALAAAFPAAATWAGLEASWISPASRPFLYLVAVVAAALLAGVPGGLVASILSFLGLNFFFTPPLRTFAVTKAEDLLALVVFLGVSSLVAVLLSRALAERARAERREHEAWLLHHMSSRLLGGDPLAVVMKQFAADMVELFRLARCDVETTGADALSVTASGTGRPPPSAQERVQIALATKRRSLGTVRLVASAGGPLGKEELEVARALVRQAAVAVERARLERETRAAHAEAEASRMRAALFSSVTHDLRTPLASIKASATSLLEEGVAFDAAARFDLLQTIVEEADRLNRLIANLLDLARMRAGVLVPDRVPTPIEDVIDSVVERLRKVLDARGSEGRRTVRVRVRDDIPPVPMDVMQIDQVLTNLLENAARYSPPGAPIEIRAARWHSWVEVRVADGGPGIPEHDRERVMEDFFRRDTASSPGGAGLGLSIARAIVVAHRGSIEIQETPGGGTTVVFRLPLGDRSGGLSLGDQAGDRAGGVVGDEAPEQEPA
jgi:two-component system, OmpR family, sensor histidine kinase KdpD